MKQYKKEKSVIVKDIEEKAKHINNCIIKIKCYVYHGVQITEIKIRNYFYHTKQ